MLKMTLSNLQLFAHKKNWRFYIRRDCKLNVLGGTKRQGCKLCMGESLLGDVFYIIKITVGSVDIFVRQVKMLLWHVPLEAVICFNPQIKPDRTIFCRGLETKAGMLKVALNKAFRDIQGHFINSVIDELIKFNLN